MKHSLHLEDYVVVRDIWQFFTSSTKTEVLTVVNVKVTVSRDVTPCSLVAFLSPILHAATFQKTLMILLPCSGPQKRTQIWYHLSDQISHLKFFIH